MNFFSWLLLGHMIGDYLLQNKWMAMNKSGSTWKCTVHCLLYTFAVAISTLHYISLWQWWAVIFISHFVIDRWSLADKWLGFINGRSLTDYITNGKKDIPSEMDQENYHALRGGFVALVYAATDNTMHLILMVCGWYLVAT